MTLLDLINPPASVRLAGAMMTVLSIGLLAWAGSHLKRSTQGPTPILITTGPYRFVRHPVYLAVCFLIPGICLIVLPAAAIMFAVIGVPYMIHGSAREDAILAEYFGEPYRRYIARTGRLFPRCSLLFGKVQNG